MSRKIFSKIAALELRVGDGVLNLWLERAYLSYVDRLIGDMIPRLQKVIKESAEEQKKRGSKVTEEDIKRGMIELLAQRLDKKL